ncbi:MAG TPA: PA0069 family radical SAM protein [Planctomycetota bacterium]|nr:PA0069 family radical SAM protein [Planctomycetota bacterium]
MRPVDNPPNPWLSSHVEWLGEPPEQPLEVYEEDAGSIVSENDSPDLPFRWSLNPYRGCFHGCAYCYARPTHQYLGFGAGTDWERRIVVKRNAPELLRQHLGKPSWRGELVAFSGVTDCYQPLEASYRLTRRCLEVCREFRQPVGIITKGALVERDVDVLADLARIGAATVFVSVPFADAAESRAIEPFVALPERRFQALRTLSDAGVPTGVSVSPLIPGLNDHEVPEILERARAAGAKHAFHVLLRLPAEVEDVFASRLRAAFPLRAEKVLSLLRSMHGGRLKDPRFHERMRGRGPRYELIAQLFSTVAKRLGLLPPPHPGPTSFRRPFQQQALFRDDA